MAEAMTDAQLAAYLNLTEAEAATILPKLSSQQRATYDRMSQVEHELALWGAGLGPLPTGVLIDFDKSARRRSNP